MLLNVTFFFSFAIRLKF